jgi:CelD/BcsL family acetyltransferase involved in cellulose biosynthesis
MISLVASRETGRKTVNLWHDWESLHTAWDDFVERHEKGSIFHSSAMIRAFHAAKGHSVLPLAAIGAQGEILALLVAVRVQTLPDPLGRVASRSILYAEPLCHDDPASIDALTSLVRKHDQFMHRRVVFTEVRPFSSPGPEKIALERCGYEFLDYLNYVLDLTPPRDDLWTKMRKSARRGVQHGNRRNFHFREVSTASGIDELYRFLALSYHRSRVPLADRSLFEAAFAELHPRGWLTLLATYDGDNPVAMDSLLTYKGHALAWYGGLARMTGVSPFDFLQWHEILLAKQQGSTLYDFGGAGWPDEPYGVRDFKAKFGGALVCYGRYRKIYAPWKMAVAKRAYAVGRKIIAPK